MKVKRELKRAQYSRIADKIEKEVSADFPVTVSERAPSQNPKKDGWIEWVNHHHDYLQVIFFVMTTFNGKAVHIKTATLGGRARIWYK